MHRLLVPEELMSGEAIALPDDAARHLKVVRPRTGEEVELFDGHGRTRRCKWDGRRLVPDGPATAFPAPRTELVLFACVTKGSRWDWTIEKAVELGVTRIVPVISDRCIVRLPPAERAAKADRWRRIAADAARQSDAVWLPDVPAASAADLERGRGRGGQGRPVARHLRGAGGRFHAGRAARPSRRGHARLVRSHDPPCRDGGHLRPVRPRRRASRNLAAKNTKDAKKEP